MSRRFSRAAADAFLLLAALVLAIAPPARAGTEEFSTFSIETQEEDDESLIDHMLTRTPRAWVQEWERSPLALRTAQGCLTSGQWFDETDLKLRASLGRSAYFGFNLRETQDDRVRYQYLDFSFHFPTRFGTAGAMFRPFYDKSRQDFAFMWDVGSDTTAFQLRLIAGLEDLFNNFWEFRQSRGSSGLSEPYTRHPYEPGLRMVVRQPGLRAELGGRYLTPSRKRIINDLLDESRNRVRTLWGTYGWASVDARALGMDWEVATTNHQASGGEAPALQPELDSRDFRRQWTVEAAARRRIAEDFTGEARWLYQSRTQTHGPPDGPRAFDAIDRVIQLEAFWNATAWLDLRVGALHDRITVAQTGTTPIIPYPTYGTRRERRAYVGLIARFGRVSIQGIEGIELDREPYDVAGVHDKGFLQLQTSF